MYVMKKTIILIGLLLVLPASIFAQEKKHEFVLGYGVTTHYAIREQMADIVGLVITLGVFDAGFKSGTGAFVLGYRYSVREKISIGLDGSYTKLKSVLKVGGEVVGNLNKHFYTIAPYVSYNYVKNGNLSMYSGIGLGYAFVKNVYTTGDGNEIVNTGEFAFHINAFGVRYGNKISAYAEAGYGYKGIMNFGVCINL